MYYNALTAIKYSAFVVAIVQERVDHNLALKKTARPKETHMQAATRMSSSAVAMLDVHVSLHYSTLLLNFNNLHNNDDVHVHVYGTHQCDHF
jgi:hypothetical protein